MRAQDRRAPPGSGGGHQARSEPASGAGRAGHAGFRPGSRGTVVRLTRAARQPRSAAQEGRPTRSTLMAHFEKPAEGSWTEHYPALGTQPVSYEDSIDPAHYELERRAIFARSWLNVGRVEQVPRAG